MACARGSVLACARHTWMAAAGPSLDVLLMADCLPLCSNETSDSAHHGAAHDDAASAEGCGLNSHSWRRHTAFPFATAAWLRPSPSLASLQMRCFWTPYRGLGLSWQKTSALIDALLTHHPTKRYYLKVDADAVLRPANLLHFLRFLHREADPEAPVYFGSAFGTYNCTNDPSDNCRSFTFNKGSPLQTDRWGKATHTRTRLRENRHWLALERELLQRNLGEAGRRRQQEIENRTAVMYAMGGVYGMSRPAAERLARSQCQEKLAAIHCARCARNVAGKGIHTHEDANIGLCMHLNQVRLVTCACFHLMAPNRWGDGRTYDSWTDASKRLATIFSELQTEVRDGLTGGTHRYRAPRSLWMQPRLTRKLLGRVMDAFHDDDGESTSMHRLALCQHPIAVHPIKQAHEYVPMWKALEVRDVYYDALLRAWRRDAATARAAGVALAGANVEAVADAPIMANPGTGGMLNGEAMPGRELPARSPSGASSLLERAVARIVAAEVAKQLRALSVDREQMVTPVPKQPPPIANAVLAAQPTPRVAAGAARPTAYMSMSLV